MTKIRKAPRQVVPRAPIDDIRQYLGDISETQGRGVQIDCPHCGGWFTGCAAAHNCPRCGYDCAWHSATHDEIINEPEAHREHPGFELPPQFPWWLSVLAMLAFLFGLAVFG